MTDFQDLPKEKLIAEIEWLKKDVFEPNFRWWPAMK